MNPQKARKSLNRISTAIRGKTMEALLEVVEQIYNDLTTTTPLQTGYARANWNLALGSPNTSTAVQGGAKGERDSNEARAGKITQQKLEQFLPKIQLGQLIILSNHVKYIRKLNNGDDGRPGDFFVENALSRAEDLLRARGFMK